MTKLSALDAAKHALASAMMNQVGTEWDENCDSVELFCSRQGPVSEGYLIDCLYVEAARYEDM